MKGTGLWLLLIVFLSLPLSDRVEAGTNQWTSYGPEGEKVRALVIDPVTPSTVYAGTRGGGVFKSTDGGSTWAAINTGLTNPYVWSLAIDPVTPSTLYAGTGGKAFKSTDGGANWVHTGLTYRTVWSLAIDPVTPSTVYAGTSNGVYKSTDGGTNWVHTGLPSTAVRAIAIDPVTLDTLYVGTNSSRRGPYKSTDGGSTWSEISTGLTNGDVFTIVIDPAAPDTPYAGAGVFGGGVFKSTDGGNTWAAINTGLTNPYVYSLAIDPVTPSTLYAGTWGGGVFVYGADQITVPLDIKPGSCPNPLNVRSKGVLPVAILGTEDFEVQEIDIASIELEGVKPICSAYEDVATPLESVSNEDDLACTEEGPDGYLDLTLKFDTEELVEAIEANLGAELEDSEVLTLTLIGNLQAEFGGIPIQGEDIVIILKKGKK